MVTHPSAISSLQSDLEVALEEHCCHYWQTRQQAESLHDGLNYDTSKCKKEM